MLRVGGDGAAHGVLVAAAGARAGIAIVCGVVVTVVGAADLLAGGTVPVVDARAVGELPVPAAQAVAVLDEPHVLTLTPCKGDLTGDPAGAASEIGGVGLGERVPAVSTTTQGTGEHAETEEVSIDVRHFVFPVL